MNDVCGGPLPKARSKSGYEPDMVQNDQSASLFGRGNFTMFSRSALPIPIIKHLPWGGPQTILSSTYL